MDWFSWLSRTNLDPCLIYQYGVTLSRNELQYEDISYFNHEFLSSMGISIAKHRLEILKLAKKETANNTIRISKLMKSIKKCVKRFVFINSSSSVKALTEPLQEPELDPPRFTQPLWKDHHQVKLPVIRTRRQVKSGPLDIGRSSMPNNWMVNNNIRRSRLKLSGPLDGRVPESLLVDDRKLKLSGPLDGNTHDRLVFSYRSPKLYASSDILNQRLMMNNKSPPPMRTTPKPLDYNNNNNNNYDNIDDDLDDKLLWAALFQDMNPT